MAIQNPAHVLAQIIASFHDEDGRIQIPGFYDQVTPITDEERAFAQEMWAKDHERWLEKAGVAQPWGEGLATLGRTHYGLAQPRCQWHDERLSGCWHENHNSSDSELQGDHAFGRTTGS